MDIAAWLRGLGLAQYEPAFRENAIDSTVLRNLTAEDLKDLGVVLVGHRRRLLDDIEALGAVEVKGIAAPVQASQVLRPNVVASRFEALRGSALSPLVGRDEEIDLLLRRWVRAKAGDGQIVLVSGEPGLGKSRLAAELAEQRL